MRVTIAQLEAFFWIGRLGSTQAAARQLNLAQPTISLRLREFEDALEKRLFEREGKGLRLNSEGSALLDRAGAVLDEMTKISQPENGDAPLRGTVRVGVPEAFAQICLPSLMRLLSDEHPALRLEVAVATSVELERQLVERHLDIAFMVGPTSDPKLRLLPLGIQDSTWIAAPGLAPRQPVRPKDLRDLPIMSNPYPSPMHNNITNWFRLAGIEPPRLNYCNSLSVIAHLVAEGVVVGFLPRKLVQEDIDDGALVALTSRPRPDSAKIYGGYRVGEGGGRIIAVLDTAQHVLKNVDFLEPL